VLGSTVHRLLHTARRPVLVVRREIERPPRRILAAVDFSTHSIEAWHAAQLLFEDMPGAASEVEILTVLDRDEVQQPLSSEQLDDFVRQELRRLVEDHLGLEGAAPDFEVRRGEPRDVIASEARERDVDLLVVGAHGRAGTERHGLIGRVAFDMAERAPCNVLVVPADAVWIAAAEGPGRSRLGRRSDA
jgi:nucleotide-binding universal stress UspA family protein